MPRQLVAILAETHRGDEGAAILVDDVEDDSLPLAQGAEYRALQRARAEKDLGSIGIAHDDPDTGDRVIGLDDALVHRASGLP